MTKVVLIEAYKEKILTLKSSLLPSQGQSGLVHWMVAFSNSMVTALSLKHSDNSISLPHSEQMNLFVLLQRKEKYLATTLCCPQQH